MDTTDVAGRIARTRRLTHCPSGVNLFMAGTRVARLVAALSLEVDAGPRAQSSPAAPALNEHSLVVRLPTRLIGVRVSARMVLCAEVTRAYSNLSLPPVHTFRSTEAEIDPTLVAQSAGLSKLLPATDAEPPESTWRPVAPLMEEVVDLYRAGYSLTAIEKKVGIAWDSVARLLDKAGARERKNKSR